MNFELKYCERYIPPYKSFSCYYNYQNYEYFYKEYKKASTYEHYIGNHILYEYNRKETLKRHQYIICGEKGHKVWADSYKVKKRVRQSIIKVRILRVKAYQVSEGPPLNKDAETAYNI